LSSDLEPSCGALHGFERKNRTLRLVSRSLLLRRSLAEAPSELRMRPRVAFTACRVAAQVFPL